MTKQAAAKLIAYLAAMYPNVKLAPANVEAYASMLTDLDEEALKGAVMRLGAVGGQFFPSIAQIRAEALGLAGEDVKQRGLEQWGRVKRAISALGANRPATFADPATQEAVDALGWRDICHSPVEQEPSWRARFCQLYEGYRRRQTERLLMGIAPPRPSLDAGEQLSLPGATDEAPE